MPTPENDLASILGVLERGKGGLPEQLHIAKGLIEVLPIPVFFKGRDGRYLGVNRAWETFFGVRREDMLGGDVGDLYRDAPQVGERHRLMDEALWKEPGSQSYEMALTTRDGRTRHTIYYKATFTRPDGEVAGLIGTIVDITERKRAEQREAIENAVGQYLGSVAPLHEAVRGIIQVMCERLDWACGARWSLDEGDNLLRCVETWSVDSTQIRRFQEVAGRETFVPGDQGLIRRVLATGESQWVEDVTRAPGFRRAALAAEAGLRGAFALPVTLGDRVLGAIEFFSLDMRQPDRWMLQVAQSVGNQIGQLMARRQAELATRESEARFRSLTELSSDWYWEQDAEYRFVQVSRGISDSVGIPQEAFIGKRRWEMDVIGLAPEQVRAHIAALDARKSFHDLEFGASDAGGAVHWVSVSGEPIFDEEGRFTGYRGIGKDITRRKTDEAALRAAHDELELKARELTRSNEELQQFAYVASHDLQEPLRMISSYTQLIVRRYDGKLDDDGREFMGYIVDGAARMKQLIEDLLAYSRVGTRGAGFRVVDSGAALDKALANLRTAQEASGAEITRDAMPQVLADGAQLTQLFQNLAGNAMKFRGAAPPRIHVGAQALPQSWVFTVTDNGIGLDPQYADRIFLMFQRLHNKTEYPGTGIGLAICKKIVERHGGRIWVESKPGEGATFGFSLPRNHGESPT